MNTSTNAPAAPQIHGNAPSLDQAMAAEEAPIVLSAHTDAELDDLHARYAEAKAESDAASKRLKDITDGIKRRLTEAAPGAPRLELVGQHGPTLRLVYTESERINTKAIRPVLDQIKAADPDHYAKLMTRSGSWTLKAVAGGA